MSITLSTIHYAMHIDGNRSNKYFSPHFLEFSKARILVSINKAYYIYLNTFNCWIYCAARIVGSYMKVHIEINIVFFLPSLVSIFLVDDMEKSSNFQHVACSPAGDDQNEQPSNPQHIYTQQ